MAVLWLRIRKGNPGLSQHTLYLKIGGGGGEGLALRIVCVRGGGCVCGGGKVNVRTKFLNKVRI